MCEEDYTSRGVMQVVTEEVWDNYWGMKKMQELVDPGGKASGAKEVRTQRHFAAFRMLLNLVLETGAVYESWAPEVLLTVPKVAGSEAMADVRPLGLLIILRNAFFGIYSWDGTFNTGTTHNGGHASSPIMERRRGHHMDSPDYPY